MRYMSANAQRYGARRVVWYRACALLPPCSMRSRAAPVHAYFAKRRDMSMLRDNEINAFLSAMRVPRAYARQMAGAARCAMAHACASMARRAQRESEKERKSLFFAMTLLQAARQS